MVIVGVLYLVFEDFVLADFTWQSQQSPPRNNVSRILVGIQIGLTALAIVVTRSSALSMQAKKGLPPGNQILGWIVLGRFRNQSQVRRY
jgi:GPI ethanolamine phosphate transferase 1